MKGRILFIWLLILLISALVACTSPATTSGNIPTVSQGLSSSSHEPISFTSDTLTPKYGGVLKIVVTNPSNYFGYNGDMSSSGAVEVSSPCLEQLVHLNAKGQFDSTGLITAFQASPDGKSVTFTLREGVKFHDGTDFNAQAVKWSLETGMKRRLAGTELFTSVELVDDYNVKIDVKHFDNRVIKAMADAKVSSPTAFDKYGKDEISRHPVGTGPFKFVSFTPDIGVTWERFDDYWGGKPYLDGIKTFFIADDQARAAALQSGDVDLLFNVSTESALALQKKGYVVAPGNMPIFWALWPDSVNESSPLSKLAVRQAIEYAIDRDALAKLGSGFWQPANQNSEPTSPGYISNFEGRPFNVNKAKELLTQAGYSDGFKISIIYNEAYNLQDSMVSLQQMLGKVGIVIEVQPVVLNVRMNYQMDGWQNGFIDQQVYAGPAQYLSALNYNLGSALNISTARPAGWQEALNQAFNADPADIDEACRKLNQMLFDNATAIPLYVAPQVIYAMANNVHDAHPYETANTFGWTPEKTWLDE